MIKLIPGETLELPEEEMAESTYTPIREITPIEKDPLQTISVADLTSNPTTQKQLREVAGIQPKSNLPELSISDLATPDWLKSHPPETSGLAEFVQGAGTTADYLTGAPARSALSTFMEKIQSNKLGGTPFLSALMSGIQQYGKSPMQAPTGAQLAEQMGVSQRPLSDFLQQSGYAGQPTDAKLSDMVGVGIEALADISPLAAMTLPGGMMKHGGAKYFKKFNSDYIGTGEGAQAFGWGHYVTDSDPIATDYAKAIAKKKGTKVESERNISGLTRQFLEGSGSKAEAIKQLDIAKNSAEKYGVKDYIPQYEAAKKELLDIPESDFKFVESNPLFYTTEIPKGEYLVWDKQMPFEDYKRVIEHAQIDKDQVRGGGKALINYHEGLTGKALYKDIVEGYERLGVSNAPQKASEFLNRAGFTGIRYPAGTLSGVTNSKAKNYVIFNDADLNVKEIKNLATGEIEKIPSDLKKAFHGSKNEFEEFSLDYVGSGAGKDMKDEAIWLTTSPDEAAEYSAGRTMQDQFPISQGGEQKKFIYEVDVDLKDPLVVYDYDAGFTAGDRQSFIKQAKEAGKDGVEFRSGSSKKDWKERGESTEFALFNPKNAKITKRK